MTTAPAPRRAEFRVRLVPFHALDNTGLESEHFANQGITVGIRSLEIGFVWSFSRAARGRFHGQGFARRALPPYLVMPHKTRCTTKNPSAPANLFLRGGLALLPRSSSRERKPGHPARGRRRFVVFCRLVLVPAAFPANHSDGMSLSSALRQGNRSRGTP